MRTMTKTARFVPEDRIRKLKARLYVRQISNDDIAAAAGVSVATVRTVIAGFCKSQNVMAAVTRLLGDASVEKTWGKAA